MSDREELVKKYPFIESDNGHLHFVDDIPEGWMKSFGIVLLDDLKDVLEKDSNPDSFKIDKVYVADGKLESDISGFLPEWYEHILAWQYIYSHTCAECGAFPVPLKRIGSETVPLCQDCLIKRMGNDAKDYCRYLDLYDDEDNDYSLLSEREVPFEEKYIFVFNRKIDLLPYYEKIGYVYKEGIKYEAGSSKLPDKDYEELCNDLYKPSLSFWEKYCEPIWGEFSNYEDIKYEVPLAIVYRSYIFREYTSKDISPEDVDVEIMPAAYAYPFMPIGSIGFRMGSGEGYNGYYWDWFNSLSLEKKKEHRRKYPIPYFHDDEKCLMS